MVQRNHRIYLDSDKRKSATILAVADLFFFFGGGGAIVSEISIDFCLAQSVCLETDLWANVVLGWVTREAKFDIFDIIVE